MKNETILIQEVYTKKKKFSSRYQKAQLLKIQRNADEKLGNHILSNRLVKIKENYNTQSWYECRNSGTASGSINSYNPLVVIW